MALSRINIMAELKQTRINLVNICFHFLGFNKEEKAKYFDVVYERLFNNKQLFETIYSDLNKKFKSLANKETAQSFANELKGCIVRIPNDEIRNALENIIKEYASKRKAAFLIQNLYHQQNKIKYKSDILQNKSQNEWDKIFKKLVRYISFREIRDLLINNHFFEFIAVCVSYILITIFTVYTTATYRNNSNELMKQMRDVSFIGMNVMFYIIAYGMQDTFIHNILYSKHKDKIKYDSVHIDEILQTAVDTVINDYYEKRHAEIEKLQERLEVLHKEVFSPVSQLENDSSDIDANTDSDEEQSVKKREKIKRRPAFFNPPPMPEMQEQKQTFDTLCLDTTDAAHRYERIGNSSASLFFHFDPHKLNRIMKGSLEVQDKFEAAILTRRYNQPNKGKLGVTELSRGELSQEESGSTHKVRIKSKERLFIELREPTPEEESEGIKRVLSPRRYASRH